MNLEDYFLTSDTEPLEKRAISGGFTRIFRTIGCVGDSLSSGEFESMNEKGERGYHDYFEYSWGQYLARETGCKVENFSSGGMTAEVYMNVFADKKDYWNPELKCQAYIIALGVNDITKYGMKLGTVSDINKSDYQMNNKTFMGYYGAIIQRYKIIQPKAKFFLVTIPRSHKTKSDPDNIPQDLHQSLMYELAGLFENTYVIDLRKYGPCYDEQFRQNFFLGSHRSAGGYMLLGDLIGSYIDFIVRHNMEDFLQVGFIGTEYHNCKAKW